MNSTSVSDKESSSPSEPAFLRTAGEGFLSTAAPKGFQQAARQDRTNKANQDAKTV